MEKDKLILSKAKLLEIVTAISTFDNGESIKEKAKMFDSVQKDVRKLLLDVAMSNK